MKIEIDTREESAADLRRIARLLEQLADKAPVQSAPDTSSDSVDPSAMPAAFGIFDDDDDDGDDAPVERADASEDFRITTY